ncbi:Pyruvate/2-oxoglutarate dehydrogenase complex, dihydrolipoamide dehydrogenase (E3) component [Amycolatopsis marina]|uniref:Pyruvate/2-oxoglutarate dehydrogenase complex, dihydrolipoamide dehydrogenase (E3) component n=1 Tax=Amycolatopsis marina TaxID=490629 RepID=A0A1I1ASG9_9PSEU|nr:FAD-dependent oxidoreductase [Amycolatopsis marina]SFB40981.1 Pyruvate/2-oxoglutarate dehydrogenase complex, dihydrolipoamide dehydrogenase (E3) component [Amycolatopsis marina]
MPGRHDLVVVGGGTAGIIAATTAARLGARVVLVERDRPGGDCLWTGCVPSKSLIAAANTAHRMRTSAAFGITPVEPRIDFAAVMAHVHGAIARIEPADSPDALAAAGVRVVTGTGVFTGPDEIRVEGERLRFRHAIIATGSSPAVPPIPGLADTDPLTSDTVWDLTELPARLIVLGGGPIGCELGQAFARLGSDVTIIEAADRLLPKEEPRAGDALSAALTADGVRVLTSTTVTTATGNADGTTLSVSGPGSASTLSADRVLAATGRRPSTGKLGVEAAGVRLDERGHVAVDAKLRTTNRAVHAAGDVTGTLPFTHVAGIHGSIAATNALLVPTRSLDHEKIPWITFTDPEIAHVGLTEDQARQRHGDSVRVRLLEHDRLDRAITEHATRGFTHVVLDSNHRVLGATIAAPRAGEMIAELTLVITRRGRLRDLASIVHAYPAWTDSVWNTAVAEANTALQNPPLRQITRALLRLRRLRP